MSRKEKRKLDRASKKARQSQKHSAPRTREAPQGRSGAGKSTPAAAKPRKVRFEGAEEAPSAPGAADGKNAAFFSLLEADRLVPRGFSGAAAGFSIGGGNGYDGMPPEEGDSDPEDAEIRYLESKLGLSGASGRDEKAIKKSQKKLRREYRLDGLGEGFLDFLTACDSVAARAKDSAAPSKDAPPVLAVAGADAPTAPGFEEDYDDDALSDGLGSSSDSEEGEGGLSESEEEAAELEMEGEEEEGGEFADATARRRAKFGALFGDGGPRETHEELGVTAAAAEARFEEFAPAPAAADSGAAAAGAGGGSAYVPPSLRRRQAGASATRAALDRKVQGLLNRVAASNVEGILREVAALPAFGPDGGVGVGAVNDALVSAVLQLCADDVAVLRSLLMVYGALLAGAHIQLGRRVGAKALEAVVLRLATAAHLPRAAGEVPAGTPSEGEAKEARNLALLLAYLYLFGVAHSELLLDVLHLAAGRLGEGDVDLLTAVLKHAGFQLRADDAVGLKALLDGLAAAGADADSARVRVMVELMADIRNNRKRQTAAQLEERGAPLRKWLSRLAASAGAGDRRLRVRWHDIMDIPSRGRWWLVGSSWAGREGGSAAVRPSSATPAAGGSAAPAGASGSGPSPADALLLKVASRMHMNTDAKRRVFVALMGAADPGDAVSRLLALDLRGAADRDIVRVLVDCAGQEKAYNPFYAAVGVALCKLRHSFKFTFQLALWDAARGGAALTTRRAYNLARLMAELMSAHALSLACLKVFDFARLPPKHLLWLRATLDAVLNGVSEEASLVTLFSRCGSGRDVQLIRDGVSLFLNKYMKAHLAATYSDAPEQATLLRRRLRVAKRALDAVRLPDDVDDALFG